MNKLYAILIIFSVCVSADVDMNTSVLLKSFENNIKKIDEKVEDNIWINKYKNYITFEKIQDEIASINFKLRKLSRKARSKKVTNEIQDLKRLKLNKEGEAKLLEEHKKSIFGNLGSSPAIEEHSKVTNPIIAISAISYIKQLSQLENSMEDTHDSLEVAIFNINKKLRIVEQINALDLNKSMKRIYKRQINELENAFSDFNIALEHLKRTSRVFELNIQEVRVNLLDGVKHQGLKLLYIIIFIIILVMIGFVVKFIFKRYTDSNKKITEKSYLINKIINITIIIISIFTLFFSYLEDVTYLVTVLGFASAGIAIAMKDWFMSVLGWFAMMLGSSIQVGNRIKILKLGQEIIGDVLDISLLKITIQEDVTLTTYETIRRAGRIVFIPNHYIFTQAIFNYSHGGLKTVWDGIDFLITFESNHGKAKLIAREVAEQYSQGYTDITRTQLNKLRRTYHLRNTNVEPRVFSFIDPNGIKISVWYQTNSFATLPLRSTISGEILDKLLAEDDIQIAYSTQTLKLQKNKNAVSPIISNSDGE